MSEIDDLRNELQELKTQVFTVSRRLTELDSSMSDHIGLDWGETLTDANSPHPNISVNTIESGGGAVRQDQYGMQVKTNGTQRGGIFFVDELETDPNQADPMQVGIYGYSNDDTLNAHVEMGLVNSSPSSATIVNAEVYAENLGDNTGRVGMVVDLEGTDTPGDEWAEVTLTRTWNRDAGRFQLYQALLGLHPGDGAGFSMGDPANAIEGDIWYNTTDNKFKGVDASATKAFLMEGDVVGMPTPITMGPGATLAIGTDLASRNSTGPTSGAFPAANRAILYPFYLTEDITVTQLWSYNGATASGNIDVGIYDSAFARQVSSGSTAQSGTNALQVFNVTDTPLTAGQYYMAVAMDNTTGTLFRQAQQADFMRSVGCFQMASAFALPSTITPASVASAYVPHVGWTRKTTI